MRLKIHALLLLFVSLVTISIILTISIVPTAESQESQSCSLQSVDNGNWATFYHLTERNIPYSIQETSDGGYIVASFTETSGIRNGDIWVAKLGGDGEIEWQASYSAIDHEMARGIRQVSDGYIVMGNTGYLSVTTSWWPDVWVFKIDFEGNIIWQKVYDLGSESDSMNSFDVTDDGGIVMAGRTRSLPTSFYNYEDAWIVKLNGDGSIAWQKAIDHSNDEYDSTESIESIQKTSEGNFIATGYIRYHGNERQSLGFDYWVVKFSSTGEIVWESIFGLTRPDLDTVDDYAYSVKELNDGNYIVAGISLERVNGSTFTRRVAWIVKLNSEGSIIWQKQYTPNNSDVNDSAYVNSIEETANGDYVIAGIGNYYGWLLKIDENGNILWERTYPQVWEMQEVVQHSDGSIIAIGSIDNTIQPTFILDLGVLKLNNDGEIDECPLSSPATPGHLVEDTDAIRYIPVFVSTQTATINITETTATPEPTSSNVEYMCEPTASFSVSGYVTDVNGRPLENALIEVSGGITTTTAADGYYTITDLIAGTYILTPSKDGYMFTPTGSYTITVPPSQTGINFVGTHLPVIFIPGIGGSSLYQESQTEDNKQVWPFALITGGYSNLSLDPADELEDNIYAGDAIREILPIYDPLLSFLVEEEGYVEYIVDNIPERRTSDGCDLTQVSNHPNLFVFAYDWRKSIHDFTVPQLEDYLGCIQQFYPAGTQVNIIAHSMGGLVARRFVIENPNVVDKFISIGSPYLGTPKAPYVYETGDMFPQIRDSILKDLAPYFEGASTLLPSAEYFNFDSNIIAEDGWDINDNGNAYDSFDNYTSFIDLMNNRYPNNVGALGQEFHTASQDDWSNDSAGVNYFHIVGKQNSAQTIGKILFQQQWHCSGYNAHLTCVLVRIPYPLVTQGDGTVALSSATRCEPGNDELNLNAPNAKVVIFTGNEEAEHTGLTKHSFVQNYIADILNGQASSINYCDKNQQQTQLLMEPAYYLKIFGSDTFTITDSLGNQMVQIDEIYEIKPDEYAHHVLGEQAHFFVLPTGRAYEVEFPVSSDGAVVELTRGDSITVDMAVRYNDVALADTHNTLLSFEDTTHTFLYDGDDNGSYESPFTPTAVVTGTAANDNEPPSIAIDVAKNGDSTAVTITAEDAGSGIKNIYYSLDGLHFELYDTPLTIAVGEALIVSVFADDNNGNRSSSEAQIGFSVYLPLMIH